MLFSSTHGTFTKTHRILGHKILRNFKMLKTYKVCSLTLEISN